MMSTHNLRTLSFAFVGLLVLGVSARDAVALDFFFTFSDDAADDNLGNISCTWNRNGACSGVVR